MTIDPQLAPFVAALEKAWPEPPESLGAVEWRRRAGELAAAARPERPKGLAVSDHETRTNGRQVSFRVFRPEAADPLPLLVYMHGGGWTIGSVDGHDPITADIAAETPCIVVSVDYALAPENPFPAALEDCIAVVEWVFAGHLGVGATAAGVFVGGDSAGGNLAAALALHYRGNADRPIAGQALIYPVVDPDLSKPSYRDEAEAPFLTPNQMAVFWDNYCPSLEQRSDPLAAPLLAENHSGLPPAFITVAEHDPVRDEGYAYAAKLSAADVPVEFRPGKGLIHGHLRTRKMCDASEREYQALFAWLRRQSSPSQSRN